MTEPTDCPRAGYIVGRRFERCDWMIERVAVAVATSASIALMVCAASWAVGIVLAVLGLPYMPMVWAGAACLGLGAVGVVTLLALGAVDDLLPATPTTNHPNAARQGVAQGGMAWPQGGGGGEAAKAP